MDPQSSGDRANLIFCHYESGEYKTVCEGRGSDDDYYA